MITKNFLKVSPAQAIWASQSGRMVYKKIESGLVEIKENNEVKSYQEYFIKLRQDQVERELDLLYSYQSKMTFWSLSNIIVSVLIMFNYELEFNSLILIFSSIWVVSAKSIISNTIKHKMEQKSRKSFYLYGNLFFR